jgi:hypothetical protein
MKSKLDWALHWAHEGFFVFPVTPNAKSPKIQDWPALATRDPAELAAWWGQWPDANIGAVPGASGHVVLDVDVKADKRGDLTLETLQLDYGPLPKTLTVETASGGRHVWLSLPGSCGNSASHLGAGIDTRGRRGFVVMPGSTIDGRAYRVAHDAPVAPAPPDWGRALAALGVEDKRERSTTLTDDPEQIAYGRRYLEALAASGDVAVAGGGGNDRTYRLATALRERGLSSDAALSLTLEHWNPHCVPPWDANEIDRIFENAYSYAQNAPGSRGGDPTGAAFAAAIPPAPEPQKRSRFAPLSIDEMAALPEPEWLLPGWLPLYATTVLYGAPGSLKSFAALDAALSVAAGLPAWGGEAARGPYPVIYVAGEGQTGVAKQRVPAWLVDRGVAASVTFYLVTVAPRAAELAADLDAMFAAIEARCGAALPRLVVYDTHARVMSGLDENSTQDTSKALDLYDATVRRYSCAVLAIHHTGKDGQLRGSTALLAGVDAAHAMEYDKDARAATLVCVKMKDAEPPKTLAFAPRQVGASIVLDRREPSAARAASSRAPSQMYHDVVQILTRNQAHSAASAMTTAALAAEMPDVLDCITPQEQETARRRFEGALRRAAARDLKALTSTLEGYWSLPAPS